MQILFNEQDVIDSVCVYVAQEEEIEPDHVDVDLRYNGQVFAEVEFRHFFREHHKDLDEQDVIDAIAVYLRDYHQFDPEQLRINLLFTEDEGIGAKILY